MKIYSGYHKFRIEQMLIFDIIKYSEDDEFDHFFICVEPGYYGKTVLEFYENLEVL